ncbi:hypothetical protein DYH09_33125, partial [bacterium CPR1]|nr:hypothetical protein [bacterium CPR1]
MSARTEMIWVSRAGPERKEPGHPPGSLLSASSTLLIWLTCRSGLALRPRLANLRRALGTRLELPHGAVEIALRALNLALRPLGSVEVALGTVDSIGTEVLPLGSVEVALGTIHAVEIVFVPVRAEDLVAPLGTVHADEGVRPRVLAPIWSAVAPVRTLTLVTPALGTTIGKRTLRIAVGIATRAVISSLVAVGATGTIVAGLVVAVGATGAVVAGFVGVV